MNKSYSIAVAQTRPVKGDVPTNIAEHIRLARLAAAEKARLVLFPELSLTGYEITLAEDLAFTENDARLAPLREEATVLGTVLIAGAPVRIESQLHIGALIMYPDRTLAVYTKQRLGAFPSSACCDGVVPPAEATVFQAGDHNPLIRLADRVAAIAICADIGNPAHPQQAAARGADAYLASMFVIPSEYDGEASKLRRYAQEHRMVVAFANYGNSTGGLASAGRSAIWSATGQLLVQLGASGAGISVATESSQGWAVRTQML